MPGGLLQLLAGRPATLYGPSPYDEQRQMNAQYPVYVPQQNPSFMNNLGLPNSFAPDQMRDYPVGIAAVVRALMSQQR